MWAEIAYFEMVFKSHNYEERQTVTQLDVCD